LRPTPNLEDQISVFMFPRDRVAQLYPQAPVSLFVAFYVSQSYGGGILTGLHTEISEESIYGCPVLLLNTVRFFCFLMLHTVGRAPWTGDQPVARPLPKHRTTQRENKRKQTSMPVVGFEPTIPAFERAKTVHALDCAATVIGNFRRIVITNIVNSFHVIRNIQANHNSR
jgi:hypothetical protein